MNIAKLTRSEKKKVSDFCYRTTSKLSNNIHLKELIDINGVITKSMYVTGYE